MSTYASAVSYADATAVRALDSHTYFVTLQDDWAIGTVPNGGYVTSCFLSVAQTHFYTTLGKQNQPQAFTIHVEFPRRTEVGPATFVVKDIKVGGRTSTIHIALIQQGQEVVLAYLNHMNIGTEAGLSSRTGWKLDPPICHVDLTELKSGTDSNWVEQGPVPLAEFRRSMMRVRAFIPRQESQKRSLADRWLCWRNGERFTNTSLGYLCDMFPPLLGDSEASEGDAYTAENANTGSQSSQKNIARFWYPTIVLNIDIKKNLPKEGVEWLLVRSQAKQIKNGRIDLEVIVFDDCGDVVALSHHVALIVNSSLNIAARTREPRTTKKL